MVQQEAIYKGATRPAMKFGVPLVALVGLAGAVLLVALWGGTLFSGWIAAGAIAAALPALAWMRFATLRDDQRLRQLATLARLCLHDRNRRFWRARSYAPYVYRGASDAWHA